MRQSRRGHGWGWGLMAAAAVGLLAGVGRGEPPGGDEALFQARLEAGEFAPAVADANRAESVEARDALMAQIAVAQARAGTPRAALRSAADIYDDRTRTDALSEVGSVPIGGRGGAALADFDSLIQLITSTIQPETWDDVGGPGSIAPFATGVYIDPEGTLRPILREETGENLAALRQSSAGPLRRATVRRASPLRKVSLPKLERLVQLRIAAGGEPTEAMRMLAGLTRIEYVFLYPRTGDLVLAGPAGDWHPGPENRMVGVETGRPIVLLDDLVVLLRRMTTGEDVRFGCMITPTPQGLARVKAFAEESGRRPLKPGQRGRWLETLRSKLGKQDIQVYGLDPRTRPAAVLVEADYRMKLVGMGLEEGVPGVECYLDLVRKSRDQAPPMDVLRWWFTLDYDALLASRDRQAFALRGQGVKVLSENELLTAEGRRVHTGASDELNRQFAASFTEHFGELAEKYPVYGELRNICDLALVCALIRAGGLAQQVGWHMTCFGRSGAYTVPLGPAPTRVDSVVNHRRLRRGEIVVGVSGGVRIDPAQLVSHGAIEVESDGALDQRRLATAPKKRDADCWWWD